VEFDVRIVFRERCVEVYIQALQVMRIDKTQHIDKALLIEVLKELIERMVERWLGGEEK